MLPIWDMDKNWSFLSMIFLWIGQSASVWRKRTLLAEVIPSLEEALPLLPQRPCLSQRLLVSAFLHHRPFLSCPHRGCSLLHALDQHLDCRDQSPLPVFSAPRLRHLVRQLLDRIIFDQAAAPAMRAGYDLSFGLYVTRMSCQGKNSRLPKMSVALKTLLPLKQLISAATRCCRVPVSASWLCGFFRPSPAGAQMSKSAIYCWSEWRSYFQGRRRNARHDRRWSRQPVSSNSVKRTLHPYVIRIPPRVVRTLLLGPCRTVASKHMAVVFPHSQSRANIETILRLLPFLNWWGEVLWLADSWSAMLLIQGRYSDMHRIQ